MAGLLGRGESLDGAICKDQEGGGPGGGPAPKNGQMGAPKTGQFFKIKKRQAPATPREFPGDHPREGGGAGFGVPPSPTGGWRGVAGGF